MLPGKKEVTLVSDPALTQAQLHVSVVTKSLQIIGLLVINTQFCATVMLITEFKSSAMVLL